MFDVPAAATSKPWQRYLRESVAAASAAVTALLLAAWQLHLTVPNLAVPWSNSDLTTTYTLAKGMIDHGWYTPNPDLGWPNLMDLSHYPLPDIIPLLFVKLFTMVTGNPFSAVNLFLVATFPAVAVAAYALLRLVGIRRVYAVVLAVAFALIPWHVFRFQHAFLADYVSVCTGLMVLTLVASGGLDDAATKHRRWLVAATVALGVWTGLSGVYYAVFTLLLLTAVLAGQLLLRKRRLRDSWRSIFAAVSIPASLGCAILVGKFLIVTAAVEPTAKRNPGESLLFAGDISSLLFPGSGDPSATINNPWTEGQAFPGIVGALAVGFTFVMLFVKLGGPANIRHLAEPVRAASYWLPTFLVAVLLFVTTGFGYLFAVVVTPEIRSWGRMSVVVICIAFIVVGIFLTTWARNNPGNRRPTVAVALLAVLTVVGVAVAPSTPLKYDTLRADSASTARYTAALEAALPAGCAVLELPVTKFPEAGSVVGMKDYSSFLPYLYSDHLKWSYGAVRGTAAGNWAPTMFGDTTNVAAVVNNARGAGFCAVQIDTAGYVNAAQVNEDFAALLGPPIAHASNNRWNAYRL